VSTWAKGLAALKVALENLITVGSDGTGHAAWIVLGEGSGVPAGAPRRTYEGAARDAQAVLDRLALGILPVAQAVFTEKCGCTEADRVQCCETALARCRLSLARPFWPCHCPCHQTKGNEGGGA
jgi:hypothetical protein